MCFKSPLGNSNMKPGFRTLDLSYNNELSFISKELLVWGLTALVYHYTLFHIIIFFVIYLVPDFLEFRGMIVSH